MEQHLNNSISGDSKGPSKIPSVNFSGEVGNAWGIPLGADACHASSDASLFSSSLPVLPHEKLNFTESEHCGQSVADVMPSLNKLHQENDRKDPLDDIELNVIGSLLPDDEDELLAGIMDYFDLNGQPTQLEDVEDDLFGSGGGMELDFEPQESLIFDMSKLGMPDGCWETCKF